MNIGDKEQFKRIPKHVGIIPDGNRRWALRHGLEKQDGYGRGINPGVELFELMVEYGIKEASIYGFTKDNTSRPRIQTEAYVKACREVVEAVAGKDANIMVTGDTDSTVFPRELLQYANKRVNYGKGLINLNFLLNYDWDWDLSQAIGADTPKGKPGNIAKHIASKEISRIDLIIRWGGRRRLSGFLPVQSVYSDFFIVEDYWPDFRPEHFLAAMRWYQDCDVTLGG